MKNKQTNQNKPPRIRDECEEVIEPVVYNSERETIGFRGYYKDVIQAERIRCWMIVMKVDSFRLFRKNFPPSQVLIFHRDFFHYKNDLLNYPWQNSWSERNDESLQRKNSENTDTHEFTREGFEHIELSAKLLDYFLRSNKSNINQYCCAVHLLPLLSSPAWLGREPLVPICWMFKF